MIVSAFRLKKFAVPDLFATDEDNVGTIFDGYWGGERVNGIPVAYFTKEQGDKVVDVILRTISALQFYRARYAGFTTSAAKAGGIGSCSPTSLRPAECLNL